MTKSIPLLANRDFPNLKEEKCAKLYNVLRKKHPDPFHPQTHQILLPKKLNYYPLISLEGKI